MTRGKYNSDFNILKSKFISNFTAAHTTQESSGFLSSCWTSHIWSCVGQQENDRKLITRDRPLKHFCSAHQSVLL